MSSNERDNAVDSRRAPPISTDNIVEIYGEAGEFITSATIQEISEQDAKLGLNAWISLPKRIQVRSKIRNVNAKATLKWAAGLDIGVEFDENVPLDDRPD